MLSLWLLVLFTGYQASVMSFTHIHIINGVTIAHSHPFAGQHQHSAGQYIQLAHLSHFLSLGADFVEVHRPRCPLFCILEVIPAVPLHDGSCFAIPSLRAPPALA